MESMWSLWSNETAITRTDLCCNESPETDASLTCPFQPANVGPSESDFAH